MQYNSFPILCSFFVVLWVVDFIFFFCNQFEKVWKFSTKTAAHKDSPYENKCWFLTITSDAFLCAVSLTIKSINLAFVIAIYKIIDEDVFNEVLIYLSSELDVIAKFCWWSGILLSVLPVLLVAYAFFLNPSNQDIDAKFDDEMRENILSDKKSTNSATPQIVAFTGISI
mmetsp:Transcript_31247/g.61872  ORF Transcript_31247/g.61872 Transcript_31247/m.61872 type:complete len:170 (-) Transcript_31247:178-687(-)